MPQTPFSTFAPKLYAIEQLTFAADKGVYFTGEVTPAAYDLTSFGRSIAGAADAAAGRTALGVVIGTNVQASNANLTALAGQTGAADKISHWTGAGALALSDFTPGAWTAWTPTVTTTTPAGSGFAYTLATARYAKVGRTVSLTLQLTLTNLGTGPTASGNLTVTLPFTAANSASGYGTENANTGAMIQGNASAASNVLTIKMATGTTAVVLNNQIRLTMIYEATT